MAIVVVVDVRYTFINVCAVLAVPIIASITSTVIRSMVICTCGIVMAIVGIHTFIKIETDCAVSCMALVAGA
jgi:hypothetical protein